jgi:iron(III) transport system substrate-binding protein
MEKLVLLLALWLLPVPARAVEPEWKEIVAAGRKEGKVVVAGSPDPVMRNEIIPKFTARFGIPVEFVAGRSSQIVARARTERAAGIYSIDVFLAGPDTTANVLYAERLVDPLKPLLVLPEVTAGEKWKKGRVWFVDPEERYVVRPFRSVAGLLFLNAEYVKPEELRSVKDLLNPRWKGKISAEDPTVTGAGANLAAQLYARLGADFVRKLYLEQKVVRTRDRRQMADWLARGTQPICLNCRADDVRPLKREGFKIIEVFELADLPPTVNGSPWMLSVANRAPHPRAAQVFANWILSKEGLEIYARGYGSATLRTDIDESTLPAGVVPKPGVAYFDDTDWKWIVSGRRENREKVWELLKSR